MLKKVSKFLTLLLVTGIAVFSPNLVFADDVEYVRNIFENNICFRGGERMLSIEGIVIHSTACPGIEARDWEIRWNKIDSMTTCVHCFVDGKFCCHVLPSFFKGAHCREPGNSSYIGIEVCEPATVVYNAEKTKIIREKSDFDSPAAQEDFRHRWENAALLAAAYCQIYGFDPMRDVISHCEAGKMGIGSRHLDPEHWWKYWDKNMDDFRNYVYYLLTNEPDRVAKLSRKIVATDNLYR